MPDTETTHSPALPQLLRAVSRSFYLSIRVLPAPLRRPISLAYLLARATDTIADTTPLPAGQRLDQLARLAAAIQGSEPARAVVQELSASFAPAQGHGGERDLILALPGCFDELAALDAADRDNVRLVLSHITRGQSIDIERFEIGQPSRAMETAAQLDEYTYLVAGSVGEFWTDLCQRHLPRFSGKPQAELRELGRRFGMGLQLVNILRDAGGDLAAGRCYFPADELRALALEPQDILHQPQRFAPIYEHWLVRANRALECGMQYADAVSHRRVRTAVALPALLGVRTLGLLARAGPDALSRVVKVPRREVRGLLLEMTLTLASRPTLRRRFDRWSPEPLAREWENRAS